MDPIDPTHDLEPDPDGGAPLLPAGPAEEFRRNHAAIARYLEQSHRDSAANRAQARELVGALEQVQASHEYLGKALRQERRRGRFLLLGLLIVPILAGLLVWAIWERFDALRGDFGDDVEGLRRAQLQMRRTDLVAAHEAQIAAHEARVASLDDDLRRTRAALESHRQSLREEETARATRESELLERIDGLERERGEILGLRARFEALRERSGAETARADALDRELRSLERELGAARERAESGVRRDPRPIRPVPTTSPTSPTTATSGAPPARPPGTNGAEAPPAAGRSANPFPGAVRGQDDLERIQGQLNRLLEVADDAVSYRLEKIGGVSGVTLLDVRLVGMDRAGRTIRALEAERAQLSVNSENSSVRIELNDGNLLLAGRKAPFFEDRYTLTLGADPGEWRRSGLSCVVFD